MISHAAVINFHSTTVIKKEHGIKLSIGAKKEREDFFVLDFSVGGVLEKNGLMKTSSTVSPS